MSYKPQPGTIAARVFAYLETLPPGTEKSSAELGEVVGQDANAIGTALAYPRSLGAIEVRKRGHLCFWSLATDDAPVTPDPSPIVTCVPKGMPNPNTISAKRSPSSFRAGLFTDGKLEIEAGSNFVVLQPDEVAQLRRVLMGGAP